MTRFITSHFRKTDAVLKQMTIWDIGLLKIGCVLFGLLLAKLIPELLSGPVWLYVVAVLLTILPLIFRVIPKYAAVR